MDIGAFLLALIAIFVAARLFGGIAERLRQPAVVGELLGGVLVGVSGLRLVQPADPTIHLLAQLGVILLLFLIGLDTRLQALLEAGAAAFVVAVAGVAATFAGGYLLAHALGFPPLVALFLGAALTATSVGISARVLADLGHLRDREAQIILGAAVIDDILGVVLLTLVSRIAAGASISGPAIVRLALTGFGFVILAILIGSRLAPLLIRLVERLDVARGLFFASLVFALSLAYLADRAGSAIVIGSFAAGLILARTAKARQIRREIHDAAHLFIPIFFVVAGAAIDIRALNPFDSGTRRYLAIGLALAAIAMVGKLAAGMLAFGAPGVRRLVVGAGMIPRGEVSLIFAQTGLAAGLLSQGLYGSVMVMVAITAIAGPLLLRRMLTSLDPDEPQPDSELVVDSPLVASRYEQEEGREAQRGDRCARDLATAGGRSGQQDELPVGFTAGSPRRAAWPRGTRPRR